MLAEIQRLEEDKEQHQKEINDLEKELLSNNCLQSHAKENIVNRLSNMKSLQITRSSMHAGSETYKHRILANQGKFAANDLNGIENNFEGISDGPERTVSMREASTVNRDSSTSVEFFSSLEQRPSQAYASPYKTANWRATLNNPLNFRQTTGLNPILEGHEEGRYDGSIVSLRSSEQRFTDINEADEADANRDTLL